MTLVQTAKGLVERDLLRIEDVVTETADARKIQSNFFLGDELVRQDVTVSLYRGLDCGTIQGAIGG